MESNIVSSGERGRRLNSHHPEPGREARLRTEARAREAATVGQLDLDLMAPVNNPLAARPSRNDPPTPNSTQRGKR